MFENAKIYTIETLRDVTRYEEELNGAQIDDVTNLSGKKFTYERFNSFILEAINLEKNFCMCYLWCWLF